MRPVAVLMALGSALAVAACNEGSGVGPALQTSAPSRHVIRLADGSSCASEIQRYESITKSDLDTGNLEQKVYDQIEREMARAGDACSSGRGGEAHALLSASKERHGYRP